MNLIAEFVVILSMTSFTLCHIIRRDASSVEVLSATMTTDQAMTSRTNALYGSSTDESFNQIPVVDESGETSEVNNILGAIAVEDEQYGGGYSYWYDAQTQDSSDQDVDVHTSNVATDTPTTSTSSSTTGSETSSGDVTTPQESVLETESMGTSDPQAEPEATYCREPPEHQLRLNFKRTNQHLKFPALAILPQEVAPADEDFPEDEASMGEGPGLVAPPRDEYVNLTCPMELLHVTGFDDLSKRSLCPWSYVPDVDPDRYPSTIQIAKCRCPQCIDTTLTHDGAFSNDNNCHQVMFRMNVLRRGPCVNDMYMYYNVYQEIPVACACVRPKV